MPDFVIKVTHSDGEMMPPITVTCRDAQEAIALVRSDLLAIRDADRIEAKEVCDGMKVAFGRQRGGEVVIRSDWVWSPEGDPELRS